MFKRELYLKRLEMYTGRDVVKIIKGMRRSGKTTMIRQLIDEMLEGGIAEEDIVYIDFEGLASTYFEKPDDFSEMLAAFTEGNRSHKYIFLDELKPIDGWARIVHSMIKKYDCEFFIISSNNMLFDGDYRKELEYKYVNIHVYPLLFSEFAEIAASKEEYKGLSRKQLFEEYIRTGAMPAVYNMDDPASRYTYLKDAFSSVILRDVVSTYKLRDVSHIDKIINYMLMHIGEAFSPKAVKDYIKAGGITISVDTVYSIIDALLGAGLIYRVPRYDIKNGRELENIEKYYFCDLGMRTAVMLDSEISMKSCMENVLFFELKARDFKVYTGKSGNSLIDFVGMKAEDRTYLNVCEYIKDNEDIKREFGPLTRIKDNYFKMVLTMDESTTVNKGGIINFPMIDFLSGN